MTRDETPILNCIGKDRDRIVFEIDRQTARRLRDEWDMFDNERDAVRGVVQTGIDELDSLRDRLHEVDDRDERRDPPAWRGSV